MDEKHFLFVNDDTRSTSRKPNRRLVNQHAQRFAMAGRRLKLAPSSAPRGWRSSKHDVHDKSSSEQGSTSTQSSSSSSKDVTASCSLEAEQELRSPRSQDLQLDVVQKQSSPPSAVVQVLDPFQTASIPIRPWTYTVIDYYTRFWVSAPPSAGPHLQRRTKIFHDAIAERVRSCLSS